LIMSEFAEKVYQESGLGVILLCANAVH
jgi:hypothetical protein